MYNIHGHVNVHVHVYVHVHEYIIMIARFARGGKRGKLVLPPSPRAIIIMHSYTCCACMAHCTVCALTIYIIQ